MVTEMLTKIWKGMRTVRNAVINTDCHAERNTDRNADRNGYTKIERQATQY